MEAERCVACGKIIPEGQQLCKNCMGMMEIKPPEAEEIERELRDIVHVLSITANTDRSIKQAMEALIRIADRLNGKGDAV